MVLGGRISERDEETKRCTKLMVDAKSREWKSLAQQSMHFSRGHTAAACFCPPHLVMVSGGLRSADSVECLNLEKQAWITFSSKPVVGHSLIYLDRAVYSIGGRNGHGAVNDCYKLQIYDQEDVEFSWEKLVGRIGKSHWKRISSLRFKRYSMSVVVAFGKIIVVGGSNGSRSLNEIEIYDPQTDKWTTCIQTLQRARQNPTAFVMGESTKNPYYLVIVGGKTSGGTEEEIEVVDLRALLNNDATVQSTLIQNRTKELSASYYYYYPIYENHIAFTNEWTTLENSTTTTMRSNQDITARDLLWRYDELEDPLEYYSNCSGCLLTRQQELAKLPTTEGKIEMIQDISRISTAADKEMSNQDEMSFDKERLKITSISIAREKARSNVDPFDFYLV